MSHHRYPRLERSVMRSHFCRLALGQLVCVGFLLFGLSLSAQSRTSEEGQREQWQRVPEIFAALGVRPGVTIADVGAGDGFFTTRLARAVGSTGRVFAVDVDDAAIERLRKRLQDDGIENVTIVKGAADDPKLPQGVLDAALIVNAYHEMEQHRSILTAIRRALKPDGRLVIVEPVQTSKRTRPRADQVRDHEINPRVHPPRHPCGRLSCCWSGGSLHAAQWRHRMADGTAARGRSVHQHCRRGAKSRRVPRRAEGLVAPSVTRSVFQVSVQSKRDDRGRS